MRVLVTDDDEGLRGEIVEYLERRGLEVEEAGDGLEAMERLVSLRPDVLVMDLQMPRQDGLATYQQLSDTSERPGQVILMSADDEQIEKARELGCHLVMKKPFKLQSLHAYISESDKDHSS